jgi:hypothetical protein
MMRMMAGINKIVEEVEGVEGVEVIEGVEVVILYHNMAARRSRNWIPNFTILLITVDNGITSLGKYTFPKMPALATNVLEVALRQEEK